MAGPTRPGGARRVSAFDRETGGARPDFGLRTEDFLEHRNTSLINNRQAGRRRGRGNNNGGGNGGGGGQRQGGGGGGGQRDTGNRIDSRARGNATQLYEKYKNLARDAQMQGDRVNIEYYLQFADHYFRVLSEQRNRLEESQPQHAPRPRIQQPFDINGDDDYADEGEPIRAGEQQGGDQQPQANQQNGQRQDRDERLRYESQRNENRPRDGQREDRPRSDQRANRDDRPARDDQSRNDQPRNEARDDQSRENRDSQPRDAQIREARGEYRDAPPRTPRAARTPAPVQADGEAEPFLPMPAAMPVNDQPDTAELVAASTEEKPRRRGRPPRDRSAEDAPVVAVADADRLPPSLGISAAPAPAAADGEPEEKPRRRRIRAATSEVQAG